MNPSYWYGENPTAGCLGQHFQIEWFLDRCAWVFIGIMAFIGIMFIIKWIIEECPNWETYDPEICHDTTGYINYLQKTVPALDIEKPLNITEWHKVRYHETVKEWSPPS